MSTATARNLRRLRAVAMCTLRVCGWVLIGVGRVIGFAWAFVRCHDLWALHDIAERKGDVRACLKVRDSVDDETEPRWKAAGLILFGLYIAGWGVVNRASPMWQLIVIVVLVVAFGVVGALPDPPDDDLVDGQVIDGEIIEGDILTGEIIAPSWPGAVVDIERDPVPIGHANGRVVGIRLDRHMLIAGMTGAGKTEMIKTLLLGVALDPRPELHVWSFKSDRDFAPLRPLCTTFGGGRGDTYDDATDLLAWLVDDELPRREREGWTSRLILVLDETQQLFGDGNPRAPEARQHVGTLTAVGRSAGVVVIISTQRPGKKAVPPEIADNLEIRVGLKVHGGPSNRLIFGESADALGLRADLIVSPGVAWLDDDGEPTLITGWLLSPLIVAAAVSRAEGARMRAGAQRPAIAPTHRVLAVAPDLDADDWAAGLARYDAAVRAWECSADNPDRWPGFGRERDRTDGPAVTRASDARPASEQQDTRTDATTATCPACGTVPPDGRTYCGPRCRKRASRQRRSRP